MAEFVVGLAKSAMEGTVTRAQSAIEEEKKLQKNVRYDLRIILDEFQMMNSFLSVTKDHVKDDMTRTLVRQVRDMALDVEDWVEYAVHVDINPSWWRFTMNWLRRMLCCVLAAEPGPNLDIAIDDIELLKARVEAMGLRNQRYSRTGDSGHAAKQPAKHYQQLAAGSAAASDILACVRGAATMYGRQVGLVELINKKKKDGALQVVSVLGTTGDLGVMSIKNAYDHPETRNSFRWRAWVKLMHPFSPREFIRCLLAQFYKNSCPGQQESAVDVMKTMEVTVATEDVLIKDFKRQIDQKYLVVLEDVSTMVDWEAVVRAYLPDKNNNGSCIVVHTQQLGIATGCVGHPHRVSEVEKFSVHHSVYVFFKEDEAGKVEEVSPDKVKRARDWLKNHPFIINRGINNAPKNTALSELSYLIELPSQNRYDRVVSVWGESGVGKTSLVKYIYYRRQIQYRLPTYEFKFGWVDVPCPFKLMDFAESLLSDLNAGYLQDCTTDPIQGCREYLRECDGLVVIDDLQSTEEWNSAKEALFSQTFKGTIIVITNEYSVAAHCAEECVNVSKGLEVGNAELCSQDVEDNLDKARLAREWLKQNQLIGRNTWGLHVRFRTTRGAGVTAAWGMSGVGKSFLVKHAYHERQIAEEMFNDSFRSGWVDVPRPFNLMDLVRRLLLNLNPGYLQDSKASIVKDPIQACFEYLRDRDGLIVIDGLQSMEEWDSVKVAFDGAFKGLIMVITNEESVAKYCVTNEKNVFNIKGLEIDHAIELYDQVHKKTTPESDDPQMHALLQPRIYAILHRCGGLPKVICAVAAESLFNPRLYDLMSWLPNNKDTKDLFVWLLSYFSSCPYTIKPCIFYLSVFPLNHTIRRRRLVRRWIAEGYSRDNEECTAEEDGEDSFLKLIRLSMVQVPKFIEMPPLCQVNGFFLEYINSRQLEDNLVFVLKDHCKKKLQCTGWRHLAIDKSWDRDQNIFESLDFSRLRSLTVFGKWESFFISDKMRLLRVLDLEDVSSGGTNDDAKKMVTNDDVEKMVKVLHCLKFLSLRNCKGITRLPESLGDLKQLETLDIRETIVVELPKSIIKIEKLQYIRAGRDTTPPAEDVASPPPAEPEVVALAVAPEPGMSEAAAAASPPTETVAVPPAAAPEREVAEPASPPPVEPEVVALAAPPELGMSEEAATASPPTEASAAAPPPPAAEPRMSEETAAASPPTEAAVAPEPAVAEPASPPPTEPEVVALAAAPELGMSEEAAAASPPTEAAAAASPPTEAAAAAPPTEEAEPAAPPTAEIEVVALAAAPEPGMSEEAAVASPPIEAAATAPQRTEAAAAPPPGRPSAPPEGPAQENTSLLARCSCATLVPNLLSKLSTTHRRVDKRSHHRGVKVPRGIRKLTNLHTLGVVNISTAGGKAILEELKNLTQLHKLAVSGVNENNCRTFFSAISGLAHLESLSLQVQVNDANEDTTFLDDSTPWNPEKKLRSLKLYGLGSRLPPWIKKLRPQWINKLTRDIKLSLQMNMLQQEEMHLLPFGLGSGRLRLFLSEIPVGGLHFGGHDICLAFLEISCSSRSETTIRFDSCIVSVLRIRCGRMLRVSGLQKVECLQQVWVSGPYDDALKQHLESEIANYPEDEEDELPKPVLRLEEEGSPIPYLFTSS